MPILISIAVIFTISLWVGGVREAVAVVIGFLAAAAVPALVLAVASQQSEGKFEIVDFARWFTFAYLISVAFVTVLGAPAFFALRPFRPGHWWSVAAAGSLLGFGVSVLLHLPYAPNPDDFVTTAPLGGASALVFWAIWKLGVDKNFTCRCLTSGG